ncbi:MAG: ferrous iron transport protein A [Selenomonadales bacterium]|nr:ferrous iron transport protein A [Selenomonadales bacterium]
MRVIPLSELPPEGCGTVRCIKAKGFLRERMFAVGIVEGAHIRCERFSPSGKAQVCVVRSARIAIRLCDSESILVRVY